MEEAKLKRRKGQRREQRIGRVKRKDNAKAKVSFNSILNLTSAIFLSPSRLDLSSYCSFANLETNFCHFYAKVAEQAGLASLAKTKH